MESVRFVAAARNAAIGDSIDGATPDLEVGVRSAKNASASWSIRLEDVALGVDSSMSSMSITREDFEALEEGLIGDDMGSGLTFREWEELNIG